MKKTSYRRGSVCRAGRQRLGPGGADRQRRRLRPMELHRRRRQPRRLRDRPRQRALQARRAELRLDPERLGLDDPQPQRRQLRCHHGRHVDHRRAQAVDRLHPELQAADPLDLHRPAALDGNLRSAVRASASAPRAATIQAAYAEQHFAADNTLVNFETTDQGLADLNAGNLDAFFIERDFLAEVAAGSNGALKLAPPEIPIGDGVGVGLRKADDELETKFNDAITAMKKDGTLSDLIVKWFPEQGPGPYYAE